MEIEAAIGYLERTGQTLEKAIIDLKETEKKTCIVNGKEEIFHNPLPRKIILEGLLKL